MPYFVTVLGLVAEPLGASAIDTSSVSKTLAIYALPLDFYPQPTCYCAKIDGVGIGLASLSHARATKRKNSPASHDAAHNL